MKTIFSFIFLGIASLSMIAHADEPVIQKESTDKFHIEVLSWSPRIFLLHNFLSHEECDHLIASGRSELRRSKVVDELNSGEVENQGRTSEGMFFSQKSEDKVIQDIENRISLLTLTPVENGEAIQMLRYGTGAEYRPHWDYFDQNTPGGAACCARGGQRIASLIMYLNSVSKGGETIFPKANINVTPKKGNAVLFYDCKLTGKEDPMTFHGGAPVLEGEKWIATKWIRSGVFK